MTPRFRRRSVNAGAGFLATLLHIALLAYLISAFNPPVMPLPEPPINVQIVEMPPLYVPPPPLRGRLAAAEASAPPRPAPAPPSEAPPAQSPPAPAKTPSPTPIPRPEVLAASVIELAPQVKPEMQAPKPISAQFAATLNPSFDEDHLPEIVSGASAITAGQAPSATAAQRSAIPSLNASQNPDLASALREAAGNPGEAARAGPAGAPGGRPGGVDDRWRVRPDGGAISACPPIAPERMTAEQRARCAKAPVRPPLRTDRTYDMKDSEFEAAARRKALLRTYRGSAAGDYPGLNCTFRGKCPK
jgi:hypothetical protein